MLRRFSTFGEAKTAALPPGKPSFSRLCELVRIETKSQRISAVGWTLVAATADLDRKWDTLSDDEKRRCLQPLNALQHQLEDRKDSVRHKLLQPKAETAAITLNEVLVSFFPAHMAISVAHTPPSAQWEMSEREASSWITMLSNRKQHWDRGSDGSAEYKSLSRALEKFTDNTVGIKHHWKELGTSERANMLRLFHDFCYRGQAGETLELAKKKTSSCDSHTRQYCTSFFALALRRQMTN